MNVIKRFFCWIEWHSFPVGFRTWKDPRDPNHFLIFAQCKWCGDKGQLDSQGNLF